MTTVVSRWLVTPSATIWNTMLPRSGPSSMRIRTTVESAQFRGDRRAEPGSGSGSSSPTGSSPARTRSGRSRWSGPSASCAAPRGATSSGAGWRDRKSPGRSSIPSRPTSRRPRRPPRRRPPDDLVGLRPSRGGEWEQMPHDGQQANSGCAGCGHRRGSSRARSAPSVHANATAIGIDRLGEMVIIPASCGRNRGLDVDVRPRDQTISRLAIVRANC